MSNTNKTVYALVFGAAAAFFIAIGSGQALAADTYAQYDTQADRGVITQMPGKSARKAEPRKVNHARYEVMAEKGIYIQPWREIATPHQLAERIRKNKMQDDAQDDTQNGADIDG